MGPDVKSDHYPVIIDFSINQKEKIGKSTTFVGTKTVEGGTWDVGCGTWGAEFEQRSERREPQRTKRTTGCRTRQQWSKAEWQLNEVNDGEDSPDV